MSDNKDIRLQKFLALCGVDSRRNCEKLIEDRKVTVNGRVADLGEKINPEFDVVKCNGKLIKDNKRKIYIMMYKPLGCICSVRDEKERTTVIDLLKNDIKERIFPIGRLDYNTEGLLLLTNDGDFMNKITHPKNKIKKTYMAQVKGGTITPKDLNTLRHGVVLDDGYKTAPATVNIKEILPDRTTILEVVISEGKNRQIRRMFESVNHEVISLKRTKIGDITLGNLPYGKWRHLKDEEIKLLVK